MSNTNMSIPSAPFSYSSPMYSNDPMQGFATQCQTAGSGVANGALGSNSLSIDQLVAMLSSMGADVDIAFAVFARQIQQLDQDVNQRIKGLDALSKLNDAMNGEMQKVSNLKSAMANKEANKDDYVDFADLWQHMESMNKKEVSCKSTLAIAQDLYRKAGLGELSMSDLSNPEGAINKAVAANKGLQAELAKYFPMNQLKFDVDPSTGKVITSELGAMGSDSQIATFKITKDQVDAYETTIKGNQNKAATARELATIGLNAVINKKSQLTQLLSNIQKKQSDTQMGVIANVK